MQVSLWFSTINHNYSKTNEPLKIFNSANGIRAAQGIRKRHSFLFLLEVSSQDPGFDRNLVRDSGKKQNFSIAYGI